MPLLINAARTAVACAVVAGTLEICARVQDQVALGVPATSVTYAAPALYHYDAAGPHGVPSAQNGKFRMNAAGFRGPDLVAGRTTVLCLGASETFGIAESGGHEFPRQLEARLDADGRARYQVVNAALPGERVSAIAATLPHVLRVTKPAVAIVYPSIGSVVWTDERWSAMHPTPADNDPPEEHWGRSRAVRRIQLLINGALPEAYRFWQRKRDAARAVAAARVTPADRMPDDHFTRFSAQFDRVLDELAAAHVRTILVTHAVRFTPDTIAGDEQFDVFRTFYPQLTAAGLFDTNRRFNDIIRASAVRRRLTVVDAAELIPPGAGNFADFFHFTDEGSARMAALLAPAVVKITSPSPHPFAGAPVRTRSASERPRAERPA